MKRAKAFVAGVALPQPLHVEVAMLKKEGMKRKTSTEIWKKSRQKKVRTNHTLIHVELRLKAKRAVVEVAEVFSGLMVKSFWCTYSSLTGTLYLRELNIPGSTSSFFMDKHNCAFAREIQK